jgi:hypothetical protein
LQQEEEPVELQQQEDVINSHGDSNDPSEYTPLSYADSDSEQEPV